MRIACICWGSLLWKTGALKLASPWSAGGPELPLEFLRDSDDSEELAIVLCEGAPLVPTFFATLATDDLNEARAMLSEREKIHPGHPEWIGSIPPMGGCAVDPRIAAWLEAQDFDAVVWTALPPKFGDVEGRAPSADEAVSLLASMTGSVRDKAEDYIRRLPTVIRTTYRDRIERELKWTPIVE